jgi:cell division protein FtsL
MERQMSKPTLYSLDKRVVKIETQLEERWKEAILRIKRIEKIIFGTAGAIILMLVSILTRM